jgi:nicastrin
MDDVSSLQTFTADYHSRTTRASNEPQTLYFTLLLPQALFFSDTGSYIIRSLQNNTVLTDKISGIFLLANNISVPTSYSPDLITPQREYGLYPNSNIKWNPAGNSLLYEAIPFPIIILSDVDTAFVLDGDSYNKQQQYRFKPLYVAEIQYTMSGFRSKNTSDCLASGTCMPIGGNSVWSILRSENKNNETIVSSARIDSYSMFRGLSSGAAAHQSSVITNLAAALTLAPYAKKGLFVRDLLFTFFDAETWGYSGHKSSSQTY